LIVRRKHVSLLYPMAVKAGIILRLLLYVPIVCLISRIIWTLWPIQKIHSWNSRKQIRFCTSTFFHFIIVLRFAFFCLD